MKYASTPAKQFSGIFVSYRRDDCAGHAGRLSDKLIARFGEDQIFMDIDNIEPGEDFVQVIEKAVSSCEILIAMIGRHWLSRAGETTRLLDNPNDFVRLEIAAALHRDIRVIPVLVQRATMPKPEDLPDDLTRLSRRNAIELLDNRWQRDVDQLINSIEQTRNQHAGHKPIRRVGRPEPVPDPLRRKRKLFIAAAALIVVTVIAVVLFKNRSALPDDSPASATPKTTLTNGPEGNLSHPPEWSMCRRQNSRWDATTELLTNGRHTVSGSRLFHRPTRSHVEAIRGVLSAGETVYRECYPGGCRDEACDLCEMG